MEEETGMPYITSIERMGRQEGLKEGLKEGLERGRRDAVVDILEARFGVLSSEVEGSLLRISDSDRLRELARLAATVGSLEEFSRSLQ